MRDGDDFAAEAVEVNLGRREFTEWLRNVVFMIPPPAMKTAIGSATTISVPCALLDLS